MFAFFTHTHGGDKELMQIILVAVSRLPVIVYHTSAGGTAWTGDMDDCISPPSTRVPTKCNKTQLRLNIYTNRAVSHRPVLHKKITEFCQSLAISLPLKKAIIREPKCLHVLLAAHVQDHLRCRLCHYWYRHRNFIPHSLILRIHSTLKRCHLYSAKTCRVGIHTWIIWIDRY